jgi:2-C-methyl-D-erythritol 4-phosphate cytidylyltransferase
VAGRPVIGWALAAVASSGCAGTLVVVAPNDRWRPVEELAAALPIDDLRLVQGGERRQDSVRAGLEVCPADADMVCVHDAARPLCPPDLFRDVLDAARRWGAATAVVPVSDSLKQVDLDGYVVATLNRSSIVAVQTPQAFVAAVLREAHERAADDGVGADDDCALVERLGGRVLTVPGDPANIKVTRLEDLRLVEAALLERDAAHQQSGSASEMPRPGTA